MLLRDLQHLLARVYGIEPAADVCDFLVTDPAIAGRLENSPGAREADEKLLIHEGGGDLGVALFIDAALLRRLGHLDPRQRLCRRNFADFCTALEGVSHFSYVAMNASADRGVTLMELEMQAEVDKYVGARALLQQQTDDALLAGLYDQLFDEPVFHDQLTDEESTRYREASDYAGRYCHSLRSRYSASRIDDGMQQDLRTFYRLSQAAKVSHIQSAVFA